MKTILSLLVLVLLIQVSSPAQNPEYRELVLKGKQLINKGNNSFSVEMMMKGRSSFERALAAKPSDELAMYYLAYSDYRIATASMKKDNDLAARYLDEGIDYAEKIIDKDNKSSEAMALLATMYGIKMSFDQSSSATLGPKSNKLINEALDLSPNNPRIVMQAGINKMYTPEFFGGSKEEALKLFKKAVSIFDTLKQTDPLLPDWGKVESMAWLGIDYENIGNTKQAVATYKNALAADPDYAWVKYSLLPEAEKKLDNKDK